MHIVAVSYSWLLTETLSYSSPLITSHQQTRKDALKMWSHAPSGDESWAFAAEASLQNNRDAGTIQLSVFTWKNKTIVGLGCLKLCDGIHQEMDFDTGQHTRSHDSNFWWDSEVAQGPKQMLK